jgi:hypothetical protein
MQRATGIQRAAHARALWRMRAIVPDFRAACPFFAGPAGPPAAPHAQPSGLMLAPAETSA